MGVIIDSSVPIAAERKEQNPREMLDTVKAWVGESLIVCSVITVMELNHGVLRANTSARRLSRQRFLDAFRLAVPAFQVNDEIALRASEIDAQLRTAGGALPLADLLIGATALHLGHAIVTANLRHFRQIAGLTVHSYPA